MSATTPAFDSVILDANAIITAGPTSLAGLATRFYTVNEALLEVRDARARQVLASLPVSIVPRVPCESSLEAVKAFARKTGDLARLSRTDLLILALTHQLEVEANGSAHLRSEPLKVPTQAGLHNKRELPACKFFGTATGCRNGDACRFPHVAMAPPAASPGERLTSGPSVEAGGDTPVVADVADLASRLERTSVGRSDDADACSAGGESVAPSAAAGAAAEATAAAGAVSKDVSLRGGLQLAAAVHDAAVSQTAGDATASLVPGPAPMPAKDVAAFTTDALASVEAVLVTDDDGDGAWITPAPLKAAAASAAVPTSASLAAAASPVAAPRSTVVCVTSDFAMQNVLLQMGLSLASTQGKLVREVKTWVLKCDACFTITDKMDKLFCPTCGNATLARLGVSVAADGAPSYHYKKHRDFNTRGTVFALPTPQGGRNGGGLLLREDQLLTGKWAQKARERAAPEPMFGGAGGDAMPTGSGGWSAPGPRSGAPQQSPELVVGYGRVNPNATRHRK